MPRRPEPNTSTTAARWPAHVRVPVALIHDVESGRLPPRCLAAYVAIAKHADSAGLAWPSQATIGALMGASERTAKRAVGELLEAGWLRKTRQPATRRGRMGTNAYVVLRRADQVPPVARGEVPPVAPDQVPPMAPELVPVKLGPPEPQLALGLDHSPAKCEPTTAPDGAESDVRTSEERCGWSTGHDCPHRAMATMGERGEPDPLCRDCWAAEPHHAVRLQAHRDHLAHQSDPRTGDARRAIAAQFGRGGEL